MAFMYQSLMVVGTVSMVMIYLIRGGGITVEKSLMRTLGSVILVRAMWFLKWEVYLKRVGA